MKYSGMLILLLSVCGPSAHALKFVNSKTLFFTSDESLLNSGAAQISNQFIDLEKQDEVEFFKKSIPNDYLDQLNLALKSRGIRNTEDSESLSVKKILLVKSIVRVNRPVQDLQQLNLQNIRNLQKVIGFKMTDPTCMNECAIAQNVGYLFFNLDVTAKLQSQFFSLQNADTHAAQILQQLQVSGAEYELRLLAEQWSSIFTLTQSLSFFLPKGEMTDIVSFQILSLKEASYRHVPALESVVLGILKKQIEQVSAFFSQTQRLPASNQYDAKLYSQSRYQLIDPQGDEALILRTEKGPKNILKFFIDKLQQLEESPEEVWRPEPAELFEPSPQQFKKLHNPLLPSIQGRNNPIKQDAMIRAFAQIIKEEFLAKGTQPSVGKFHVWSPEMIEKYKAHKPLMGFSKLLLSLSFGFTDRFLKTDQETALRSWILQQDYNSLVLPQLFRKSYQLNNGDVYLTLLTIENVLAANWRYQEREDLPVSRRLKPITSGYNYDQDRYGTWYHLFGMILYGFVEGATTAQLVGKVEALGSNLMQFDFSIQTQKQWMNKQGGLVGAGLRKMLDQKLWHKVEMRPENLQEANYLDQSEDFRDRRNYPIAREITVEAVGNDENLEALWLSSHDLELKDCRIDVVLDKGSGLDSRFQHKLKSQSIRPDKKSILRMHIGNFKKARLFIYDCANNKKEYVLETQL